METDNIDELALDTLVANGMAEKVEFLNKREKAHYADVLIEAMQWGRKKDKENKEYFKKNHLIDKYNV